MRPFAVLAHDSPEGVVKQNLCIQLHVETALHG
jgi:hypothetical protein